MFTGIIHFWTCNRIFEYNFAVKLVFHKNGSRNKMSHKYNLYYIQNIYKYIRIILLFYLFCWVITHSLVRNRINFCKRTMIVLTVRNSNMILLYLLIIIVLNHFKPMYLILCNHILNYITKSSNWMNIHIYWKLKDIS